MSAIASLTVVPRDSVTELARLARTSSSSLHAYLAEHGSKARQEYDWSGYCMLYVLTYLEERGVDLEQSEFDVESEAINSAYGLTTLIPPAPGSYWISSTPPGTARRSWSPTSRRWGWSSRRAARLAWTRCGCCASASPTSATTRCCSCTSAEGPDRRGQFPQPVWLTRRREPAAPEALG
ncbi:hypothetical protein NKG94_45400 [Micromonospora sp. M12]